jgi:hypothetical protein
MTNNSVFNPNGTATTKIATLAPPTRRVNLSDPAVHGWEKIKLRLEELSRLELGWDGYRGVPMRFEIGYFAAEIIKSVCDYSVSHIPQIIPGANGDVQLEWHYGDQSIELHIRDPFDVIAWRTNKEIGEDGQELHLSRDFTIVSQWLREFSGTRRTNAASAA